MKKSVLAMAICSGLTANTVLAEETSSTISLNNIVVSGEKQDKTLKDTTSSVSVIDEQALQSTRFQNLQQVIAIVPNVVTQTGAVPNVRGITGNGAAGGFNSVTGGANARFATLVDGVVQPFVADLTGDSGLWDMQQVEVYRGPQSTNNGKNSIAGAMYIKTNDPTFDWDGKVRLAYRNKQQYFDKAIALSGPIIDDKLAFRVSGQIVDGQTITGNDDYPTNPADFDLNELDTKQGRAKLLWKPTENFETLFTYSKYREEGDTGRRYFIDEGSHNFIKTDSLIRDYDTKIETISLDNHYKINNATSIDFLVASMDYTFSFNSYDATPSARQTMAYDERNTTVDTKINFGQDGQDLSGFLGFYYYKSKQDIDSSSIGVAASNYFGDDKSVSKALYGELNYALTSKWTLIGGLRYQDETQDRNFTYTGDYSKFKESNSILLPKVAVQYDLNATTRLGLSARKGYNSGGAALNTAVAPYEYYYYEEESVNTYEFFTRKEFADGRISLNSNLFYNEYKDYQGQNSARRIVNVDKVETYGAEIESTIWVTDDLELAVGVGLLHTEVKKGGDNYLGVDGNELNSAPKKTGNIDATYYLTDNFNIGGNIQYVGSHYGDVENTDERRVSGYSLINLRANYEVGNLLLSAYVNNLTDKHARRMKEPANPPRTPFAYADFVDPRHFGVSATYSFF